MSPAQNGIAEMELRHLKYFVAVAEEQSISRAAERLNIAQQPLSRQIRDLEKELRVTLLTRDSNQIHLTAAGRAYLRVALDILSRMETATRRVRALASEGTEEFRAGPAATPQPSKGFSSVR